MFSDNKHFHGILRRLPSPVIVTRNDQVVFVNTVGKDLLLEFNLDQDNLNDILIFFSLSNAYDKVISGEQTTLKKQAKISLPSGGGAIF